MAIFVSRSGGWISAISPHSKRERRRSSMAEISFGGQSEEITICFCWSYSALNVWKNSSWVRSRAAMNWISSTISTSMVRKRSRKSGHALEADRGDHFVGEFLGADVGEPQRRVALLEVVADRLHQVRLAQAHSAVEEQRVVGFRRLLGHGLRGGVRELVRGADDKRVEGIARVQLVVRRIEIEPRLWRRGSGRSSRKGLRFEADEIDDKLRPPDFDKDRL